MNLSHSVLKSRQREERVSHPPGAALRIHRALSWLDRAERCGYDEDGRFLFLWIAFNAAYSNELPDPDTGNERKLFSGFVERLCTLDNEDRLYGIVWSEFPKSIRLLLDNRYVFQPFWDYRNDRIGEEDWQQAFGKARRAAHKALANQDTSGVISITLARLYTLRNQLVHGGATWNSSVNRAQVRDCGHLLGQLVPTFILIMLDHPDRFPGTPCYPPVDV